MQDSNEANLGNIKICVIGLGYVGLPLAAALSKKIPVIGFDIKERRIEELKNNFDRTKELNTDEMKGLNIEYSSNPSDIGKANFIIVAVPTPLGEGNTPDLSLIIKASELVGSNLKTGCTVVYESTVYPGVTEEVCLPILEKNSGLKCPEDFKIGYSPERINPGDKEHTINKITKVVSGIDAESLEAIAQVYGSITDEYKAKSIKVAEGAKVIENIQRDLNIALMNELSFIFDKIGIST